jgi:phosphoribosyl-ATP pyrophosphohydrolase
MAMDDGSNGGGGAPDATVLDRLFATIAARRGADPATSYTAKLFARGTEKIAQKLGEEAVEAVIATVEGKPEGLVAESADLLYHLLVAWANAGVAPAEVWRELERRTAQSGIAEKQSRPNKG